MSRRQASRTDPTVDLGGPLQWLEVAVGACLLLAITQAAAGPALSTCLALSAALLTVLPCACSCTRFLVLPAQKLNRLQPCTLQTAHGPASMPQLLGMSRQRRMHHSPELSPNPAQSRPIQASAGTVHFLMQGMGE